jgi:SAM-dependent methyltransferase
MLKCRSCLSDKLGSIIPLGKLPLANALLSTQTIDVEPRYNLEVMLCEECGLAQLKDLIDPVELFSDYVYFSSNSDAMLSSVAKLVEEIIPTLPQNPFVIEIASNDGYLLKNYVKAGFNVLGIDPAKNIAKVANENGIPTLCDFFSESLAANLAQSGEKADIIHANNVMAHVPDINDFIKGLKTILKENGKAIIEVPYFLDLVKNFEFDTIYHEHVYYFSVSALKIAFERHGLEIVDIEKIKLHGGSLRLFVSHANRYSINQKIVSMMQDEENFGLYQLSTFRSFMERLAELKMELTQNLKNLKLKGAKIAAYGASAKGTTLLNYFNIGRDIIEFVVDRGFVKNGKFTPGTQLEILSPSKLIEENISHALLLVWNFAEEIMSQQKEFIDTGGKFIIPLPKVEIVS